MSAREFKLVTKANGARSGAGAKKDFAHWERVAREAMPRMTTGPTCPDLVALHDALRELHLCAHGEGVRVRVPAGRRPARFQGLASWYASRKGLSVRTRMIDGWLYISRKEKVNANV